MFYSLCCKLDDVTLLHMIMASCAFGKKGNTNKKVKGKSLASLNGAYLHATISKDSASASRCLGG